MILAILLLGVLACSVFSRPAPVAISQAPVAPFMTQTPTPFQPVANTQVWAPTKAPVKVAAVAPLVVETPAYFLLPMPTNEVNLVLLGSDQRYSPDYRTDTIILMSINPANGSVSLVSIPRDLWLDLDGVGEQRINTAMEFGGFPLLATTFQKNFGVRPRYYLMINFDNFVAIIDAIGGVTVNAGKTLRDQCDLPQADASGSCLIQEGQTIHMDGATALWYVRSRHTSSDFDRLRRAQEVLYGVSKKLLKPGFALKIPALYSQFQSSVETNMDFDTMISLLPMVPLVLHDTTRIHLYSLGAGYVTDHTNDDGQRVLLPVPDAIHWLMYQAVYPQ